MDAMIKSNRLEQQFFYQKVSLCKPFYLFVQKILKFIEGVNLLKEDGKWKQNAQLR